MNKPIVHYDANKGCHFMQVGTDEKPRMVAHVWPLDHSNPEGLVSNTKPIFTSEVVKMDKETGEFETLNSIYKPAKSPA